MRMSTPPVAKFCKSATVAWPSGLVSARSMTAMSSKCRIATRCTPEGPAGDRAPAHLVFAQARDALCDRDVGLEVVFVEDDGILRRQILLRDPRPYRKAHPGPAQIR